MGEVVPRRKLGDDALRIHDADVPDGHADLHVGHAPKAALLSKRGCRSGGACHEHDVILADGRKDDALDTRQRAAQLRAVAYPRCTTQSHGQRDSVTHIKNPRKTSPGRSGAGSMAPKLLNRNSMMNDRAA